MASTGWLAAQTGQATRQTRRVSVLLNTIRHMQSVLAEERKLAAGEGRMVFPAGFSQHNWPQALESFAQRWPEWKRRQTDHMLLRVDERDDEEASHSYLIAFGPEWELREAERELFGLLSQPNEQE